MHEEDEDEVEEENEDDTDAEIDLVPKSVSKIELLVT